MKIKFIVLWGFLFISSAYAKTINDTDFDGVPDTIDKCQNTPFLAEVDKHGCTVTILSLPSETQKESLTLSLSYGYSTNEDLIDREVQHNTKIQLNYYLHNWSYTLQTGYYTHNQHEGMLDTTLKIKKRIKLNPQFILGLGSGLQLPSFDFEGNKIDTTFYSSLHYYPTTSFSFFMGYDYSYIGDDEIETVYAETPSGDKNSDGNIEKDGNEKEPYEGLQNKHKFYGGIGYFFTDRLYANLFYTDQSSKFVSEHNIRTISSTIYYKIDPQWFTTLYYRREVLDEDLHDNLLFTIGYHIW